MQCAKCRSGLFWWWRFCPECGEKVIKQPDRNEGGIQENEMIQKDEVIKLLEDINQSDVPKLMLMLEAKYNEMDNTMIKVALVGPTGSGKSSLINALRCIKDDEKGAAKTGCTETTKEPTGYPFPNHKNVQLWDMPGVGSINFTKDDYIERMKFEDFDFILLVTSTRFTADDAWLANNIKAKFPVAKIFFIRTKIENDIRNINGGRRRPMTEKEKQDLLDKIRRDCTDNLIRSDCRDPCIFLLDNHRIYEYEFRKFLDTLLQTLSGLKKNILVMAMSIITEIIVPLKIQRLRERKSEVSKLAAKVVVTRKTKEEGHPELDILKAEIDLYMEQLGINKQSVNKFVELFDANTDDVEQSLALVILYTQTTFNYYIKLQDTQAPSFWFHLPIIGKWLALKEHQTECYNILDTILECCIKGNKQIFEMVEQFAKGSTRGAKIIIEQNLYSRLDSTA
ncbi:interferon-inducible GTPase 1-like [Dreissena polymorpha]|uniref:IRG-type G domain-containing protein n=1 Tax=Dreissena polymorpha TaxID=45954 RepID=A0A9D4H5Z1_DREPO|nr:interferon-inducible GTPase 1-like [Dreissena polymorpha]XP_052213503.1 interferon-inducible GTPase 1-like [Dreissena polymorpha]KAH3829165.1 hypothetical protein DPMN_131156 [Dreissena polymorpha]KAH3829193.1 hypothetical protein DPMN_131185 [Dreissena polymorpha]